MTPGLRKTSTGWAGAVCTNTYPGEKRKWRFRIVRFRPVSKQPLKQILAATRDLWNRTDISPAVRENFAKMIDCRTPALGHGSLLTQKPRRNSFATPAIRHSRTVNAVVSS
jgi:hypothetical protein